MAGCSLVSLTWCHYCAMVPESKPYFMTPFSGRLVLVSETVVIGPGTFVLAGCDLVECSSGWRVTVRGVICINRFFGVSLIWGGV